MKHKYKIPLIVLFSAFLLLPFTWHKNNVYAATDRSIPLYADRYYCDLHIYGVSLFQVDSSTIRYRATFTNRSGRHIPAQHCWLYFYDINGNLTFLMRGCYGSSNDGETSIVMFDRGTLSEDDVNRCLTDTYTYRIYGDGTDDEDRFVNADFLSPTMAPSGSISSPAPDTQAQDRATALSSGKLSIKQHVSQKFMAKLSWKKAKDADAYAIYRGTVRNGNYQRLKKSLKKNSYTDATVKAGKTYYYLVIPYKNGTQLESTLSTAWKSQRKNAKRITLSYFKPPIAKIVKKRTSDGQLYLEITLKKYQGNTVEIYVKQKGKYKRIPLKSDILSAKHKTFRLSYHNTKETLSFKIRTSQKIHSVRRYSLTSKIYKITL